MKITEQELIEFADEQNLIVFGKNENLFISKMNALQRLVRKGLIPKPDWEGGKRAAYWENDTEIKDRIIWIDEQKKTGKSYKKMYESIHSFSLSSDALQEIEPILKQIDVLIDLHPDAPDNYYIKAMLYEKAEELNKSLELYKYILSKNEKDEKYIPLLYEAIIGIYHTENRKEKEKEYCERFITFAQDKDDDILGRAYLCMADYLMDIDAQSALQNYLKAEKLITTNGKLAELYGMLSYVERYLKDTEKAKEHILKAIELFPENSIEQAHAIANYSVFFFDEENYDDALKYLLQAKEILNHRKDILNESVVTITIGINYLRKKDYKKALKMFRFGVNNLDPAVNPVAYKSALKQLSSLYNELGDEKKSKFYQEEQEKIDVTYLGQKK